MKLNALSRNSVALRGIEREHNLLHAYPLVLKVVPGQGIERSRSVAGVPAEVRSQAVEGFAE